MTRFVGILSDDRDFKGGISFLGAERRTRVGAYIPYQRPILDQSTGRVMGMFGLDRVAMDADVFQLPLAKLQAILERDGGVFLDASSNGQSLMVLARFSGGKKSLFILDRAGLREKELCFSPIRQNIALGLDRKPTAPGDTRLQIFSLDRSGRPTSEAG